MTTCEHCGSSDLTHYDRMRCNGCNHFCKGVTLTPDPPAVFTLIEIPTVIFYVLLFVAFALGVHVGACFG